MIPNQNDLKVILEHILGITYIKSNNIMADINHKSQAISLAKAAAIKVRENRLKKMEENTAEGTVDFKRNSVWNVSINEQNDEGR